MVKVVAVLVVTLMAVGLWAFEPWRLLTESRVDEPLPAVSRQPSATVTTDAAPAGATIPPSAPPSTPPPELVVLKSGSFEDAEHDTSGDARVLQLSDGSRFVRLEDLGSSDGPDLHVWLSDQPSGGAWGSYDDGRHVALGDLKATDGNQNYEIPADVDLDGLSTVVIWCDRFNVAFGTAALSS